MVAGLATTCPTVWRFTCPIFQATTYVCNPVSTQRQPSRHPLDAGNHIAAGRWRDKMPTEAALWWDTMLTLPRGISKNALPLHASLSATTIQPRNHFPIPMRVASMPARQRDPTVLPQASQFPCLYTAQDPSAEHMCTPAAQCHPAGYATLKASEAPTEAIR
jgi:hypothetical protein